MKTEDLASEIEHKDKVIARLHAVIENHELIGELVYRDKMRYMAAVRNMLFTGLSILNPEEVWKALRDDKP